MAACSSSYSVYAEETKAEATRVEESKEEGVRCDLSWWDMNDDDQQLRNWFDYLNKAYFGGQLKVNHINYRSGMYDPLAQTASDGHELASFKSLIQRLKRLGCRVREAGVIVLI